MSVPVKADGGGQHASSGKVRYDLIPADVLHALAEHYTRNLAKYPERNWERGMRWTELFGSVMRHAWAWFRGQTLDPENGAHHMIAVAWNAMALVAYDLRGIGTDDRPVLSQDARFVPETGDREDIPALTDLNRQFRSAPFGREPTP